MCRIVLLYDCLLILVIKIFLKNNNVNDYYCNYILYHL